jgi:hypothetical protein
MGYLARRPPRPNHARRQRGEAPNTPTLAPVSSASARGDMTLTWTPAEQAAPVRSGHERTLAPEGVAGRSDELLVCRDDRLFPVDWLRRVAIERVGITPTRSMAVTASS